MKRDCGDETKRTYIDGSGAKVGAPSVKKAWTNHPESPNEKVCKRWARRQKR